MSKPDLELYEEITKEEFDNLCRAQAFCDGPFAEEQPKEYGAPYIAPLWLFGTLTEGERRIKAKRA